MKLIFTTLSILISINTLSAQDNPYISEEVYPLAELEGHSMVDYYHSDDMFIYVISSLDNINYLTKIDTAGQTHWSINTNFSDLEELYYDREAARVIATGLGQVKAYNIDGEELISYTFPDSLILVGSNAGIEYYSLTDTVNTKFDSYYGSDVLVDLDFRLRIFTYSGNEDPTLIKVLVVDNTSLPDDFSYINNPAISPKAVKQFGSNYFDFKVNYRWSEINTGTTFRREFYYRVNWNGDVIKSQSSQDEDSGNSNFSVRHYARILHSGTIVDFRIIDEYLTAYINGEKIYGYSCWFCSQFDEITNDYLLIGNRVIKDIENNEVFNLDNEGLIREIYKYAIDHTGVMYGISSTPSHSLNVLKWIFVDEDEDGFSADFDDCDDTDAAINPSVEEIYNNDIDENCDGQAEQDLDEDGYGTLTDCNDLDDTINPDANEIVGNEIDENCDGIIELDEDEDGISSFYDCDDGDAAVGTSFIIFLDAILLEEIISAGFDRNNDIQIDCIEARLVDSLDIESKNISSLEGIEAFINLQYLNARKNDLEAADLSALTNLNYLNLERNHISELILPDTSLLEFLDVSWNDLSVIEFSNHVLLKSIDISNTGISKIEVDSLMNLEFLVLDGLNIDSLVIKNHPTLRSLSARYSYLHRYVELSDLLNLEELLLFNFSENSISLDFSLFNLPKLAILDVRNVRIQDASFLSEFKSLENLGISNNSISEIDISGLEKLETLSIRSSEITAIDISENPRLTYLDVYGNPNLRYINIQNSIHTDILINESPIEYACIDSSEIALFEDLEIIFTINCGEDIDDDGIYSFVDCNDEDPFINPFLSEIPYNGIDDDCNEQTLDDDLDNDGFELELDCDDSDPNINPFEEEVPYNGIDDDCNEQTLDDDLDQDSYGIEDDCDDQDALINPAAEDIPENGIDEDCDGEDAILSSTDNLLENKIRVFPNPFTEEIKIASEVELDGIEIYNLSGNRMRSIDTNKASDFSIDTTRWSSGMYLVVLYSEGKKVYKRMVKI